MNRILDIIKRISLFQLLLISVMLSEILTLMIVIPMSIVFRGQITYDYLITGTLAAFFVSFIVVSLVIYFTKELQRAEKRLQESEEDYSVHRRYLEGELQKYNHELEDLVKERTEQLEDTIRKLEREITERKLVEEALQQSEQCYRDLIENAPDVIYTLSEDGAITSLSPAFEKITGFTHDEWIGKNFAEIIHPDDLPFAMKMSQSVFRGETPLMFELRSLSKSGEYLSGEFMVKPQIRDGRVVGMLGICRDITGRKKTEDLIRNILETVDEGFIIIDREFRIISANRAYCEQMKTPDCDIIGRHCYEISHHLKRPCFLEGEECAPAHTFKTGTPSIAIHTHYDREGYPVYTETKSYPVKDASGKVISVIETLNNITEKRRLEEQLRHAQKMEAIGTLAGGIAHDFNNMLNVILGYGGLMQMRMKEDDPYLLQLREILEAGQKAAQLTRGLLIFSRRQELELRPVNIKETIDEFKKMIERIIGEDIELRIITNPPAPPFDKRWQLGDLTVMADSGHLEQVLMNLAVNARDAMYKGGILGIEVNAVRIDNKFIATHGYGEPGEYALISVSDTGAGMDERTRERIFEPYFTTKGIGKGTGLGLSIVYGIVKQHNGYIHCYSESGKGTTFKIYLPIVRLEGIETEEAEVAVPKGGTETVLVAEDDPAVRNLTKTTLESFGYKVIEAVDGEDAVSKFKENKDNIMLLLFDVIMPRKNGGEAYEDIKGMKQDIKVIFMSGYTADIVQSRGILENGIEFISKPVSPNELLKKVRECLDKNSE